MVSGIKFISFTTHVAEFLQSVAPARPDYWNYQMQQALLVAIQEGWLDSYEETLIEKRNSLKRNLLELPPDYGLNMYVTGNSIMHQETNGDGKRVPVYIEIEGGDVYAWLNAAYINARRLIQMSDVLIELCSQARNLKEGEVLFVLDPPLAARDPRAVALSRVLKWFDGMDAEEVLVVFDRRSGQLDMKGSPTWINASVAECIRLGLNLEPRELDEVAIRHNDGSIQSWRMENAQKSNRFGNILNSARDRYAKKWVEIEPILNSVTSMLRQVRMEKTC